MKLHAFTKFQNHRTELTNIKWIHRKCLRSFSSVFTEMHFRPLCHDNLLLEVIKQGKRGKERQGYQFLERMHILSH